jgi:DNA-binding transcriptional regulator YiaG
MVMRKAKRAYPNKETLWSYFMQAIEPSSEAINKAFPEYHPMWVIQSQRLVLGAEQFKYLRKELLGISQEQCAAYMRVSLSSVRAWEKGSIQVPFMAVELLRLVYESPEFRLSHNHWQGWFINRDGRLVSPDSRDLAFAPHELSYIRETHRDKALYELENQKLRAEVEHLRAENAELTLGNEDLRLVEELKLIEKRLCELSRMTNQRKVVKLHQKQEPIKQEAKCA